MNERIRELAKQTGYIWHASGDPQIYEFTPEKLDRFAELIVGDCLFKIRLEAAQYLSPDWRDNLVNNIKGHFGVEE